MLEILFNGRGQLLVHGDGKTIGYYKYSLLSRLVYGVLLIMSVLLVAMSILTLVETKALTETTVFPFVLGLVLLVCARPIITSVARFYSVGARRKVEGQDHYYNIISCEAI